MVRGHGQVHGLRRVRRRVPDKRSARVGDEPEAPQGDIRAVPAGGPAEVRDRPRALHRVRALHAGVRAGRDQPDAGPVGRRGRRRRDSRRDRVPGLRPVGHEAVQLRRAGERGDEHGVREDMQRRRADRGRAGAAGRKAHKQGWTGSVRRFARPCEQPVVLLLLLHGVGQGRQAGDGARAGRRGHRVLQRHEGLRKRFRGAVQALHRGRDALRPRHTGAREPLDEQPGCSLRGP